MYEVTLSKDKEYVWFKLKNDNVRYKATIYSKTGNQIIYSGKFGRDRSFRYIPEKKFFINTNWGRRWRMYKKLLTTYPYTCDKLST